MERVTFGWADVWWVDVWVSLAALGILWCFWNYSGFSFLWSKVLEWSPWTLTFVPFICVSILMFSLFIVLLYLGCWSLFFPVHVLWFFLLCFFFPSLDLQIHQVQWHAAVWQLSPRTLLCLCTCRTYVGYFSVFHRYLSYAQLLAKII